MARTASRRLKAAEAARELAARYAVRERTLLETAEEFLAAQEEDAQREDDAKEKVEAIERTRGQERAQARRVMAGLAARMRAAEASEGEIATRLGLGVGEVRRLVQESKDSAAAPSAAGGVPEAKDSSTQEEDEEEEEEAGPVDQGAAPGGGPGGAVDFGAPGFSVGPARTGMGGDWLTSGLRGDGAR